MVVDSKIKSDVENFTNIIIIFMYWHHEFILFHLTITIGSFNGKKYRIPFYKNLYIASFKLKVIKL